MMKYIYILLVLGLMLCGCSYSVNMNSLPHLKTLRIENFENKSTELMLHDDLLNELSRLFNEDNRLILVNKNPDSIIEGKILDYADEAAEYDMQANIEQKRVRILFQISFKDLKNDETIWESKSLTLQKKYIVSGENNGDIPESEEDAVKEIFQDLFDKIIKNTLEAW